MPRPLKVCSFGEGCLNLAPAGQSRCAEHQRAGGQGYRSPFYDSPEWRRITRAFLRAHPRCVLCGASSKVTDHKTPRVVDSPLDRSGQDSDANLQALCRRCHGTKTAEFDGGYGRPRRAWVR